MEDNHIPSNWAAKLVELATNVNLEVISEAIPEGTGYAAFKELAEVAKLVGYAQSADQFVLPEGE